MQRARAGHGKAKSPTGNGSLNGHAHHHGHTNGPANDTADGPLPPGADRSALQWPIIMLALPPFGSLFFGTAQGWSDSITLVLIGIYLYYLVKVPWELYHAAQTDTAMRKAATSLSATAHQRAALARLRQQEWFSFGLVLLAPLLGGYTLHLAKNHLSIATYLTPGNIFLYVLAASMRPLTHLVYLLQGRAVQLHREFTWQDADAVQLRRRLDQLELSLRELRLACATEDDVDALKEEVRNVLDEVSRGTRGQSRRLHTERNATAARIDMAEERVREVEEWCERQRSRKSHSLVLRCVWEPVSLFREVMGIAGVPLLGLPSRNSALVSDGNAVSASSASPMPTARATADAAPTGTVST